MSFVSRLKYVLFAALLAVYVIAIGLVGLRLQWSTYAHYWNQKNSQTLNEGELIYIALGDSTAQAIGAYSPDQGYVAGVAKGLAKKTGRSVRIINLSKTGAKIRDVIDEQLPRLNDYPHADYLTVAVGANNIRDFNSGEFRRDFGQLVTAIPSGTYIADIPTFGGRNGNYGTYGHLAAETSRELIRSRPDIHLVLLEQGTVASTRIWDYGADLFHPNTIGYRAWTRAFLATMM